MSSVNPSVGRLQETLPDSLVTEQNKNRVDDGTLRLLWEIRWARCKGVETLQTSQAYVMYRGTTNLARGLQQRPPLHGSAASRTVLRYTAATPLRTQHRPANILMLVYTARHFSIKSCEFGYSLLFFSFNRINKQMSLAKLNKLVSESRPNGNSV